MGPENQNPLSELQLLEQQVDQITELARLKPIFARVNELAKEHPGDFEVQLAASEVKQRVLTRGSALKQLGPAAPPMPPPPLSAATPPPMPVHFSPDIPASPPAPPADAAFKPPPVLGDRPLRAPKAPALPPRAAPPPTVTGKAWKSALLLGAIAGVMIAGVFLVVLVSRARVARSVAPVAVRVTTAPPGRRYA